MRQIALVVICVTLVIPTAFSGCIDETPQIETEVIDENYPADENTTLRMVCLNADIEVSVWSGSSISLRAEISTWGDRSLLDEVDVEVTETPGEVLIETFYSANARDVSVRFAVGVPLFARVGDISTSNGFIDLRGTRGDCNLTTTNGFIDVNTVNGVIGASTNSGSIWMVGTAGIGNLTTFNENINVEVNGLRGNTSVTSSVGSIILWIDPSIDADLEITTTIGHVEVDETVAEIIHREGNHVLATVGQGGDVINVTTEVGDININRLLT
jgi:hypothetical protein